MTQITQFKQSMPLAAVTLLQSGLPALVTFGSLWLTVIAYGGELLTYYQVLGILAAMLAMLILGRDSASGGSEFARPEAVGMFSLLSRWLLVVVILLLLGYATKSSALYSRRVVLTWICVNPLLLAAGSALLARSRRRLAVAAGSVRSVVIAGCNDVSLSLAQRLCDYPELCMRVDGFFDDRGSERLGVGADVRLLGRLSDLADYARVHGTDVIFISLPIRHIKRVLDLLDSLRDTTLSIYYVPDIFAFDLIQSRTDDILGIPVVAMCETPFYGYRGFVKRGMDIALSALGLLVLALPMACIGLIIRLTSRGPALFRQRRYGLDGQQITVYKFRTMSVQEDGDTIIQARRDDHRVTSFGAFLRRTSLDELPQLINVLQGRMSLVGPRPHAVAHNEEYRKLIKGYMVRHKVLPGITGLAQVNGCRGETSRIEEMQARINFDLEYLRRWSPALDLRILYQTVLQLLRDDKAY